MPAERASRWVALRIPSIAVEAGQVNATDERDPAIDNDRLLVVAVHRPLVRIQGTLDSSPGHEVSPNLAQITSPGPEHGDRRTRPDQHPNRDAGGDFGQQLLQDGWALTPSHGELGREMPTGEVHRGSRSCDGKCHRLQRVRAVDHDIEGIAVARRRIATGPDARARIDRRAPAHTPKPSTVV